MCEHDLKKDYNAHTYEDSIVPPTYDEGGYTLHTCSVCGYSYKDAYTNPIDNPYRITYNLDGGTNDLSNPSSFNEETTTITLKDPTRTGYRFLGWTTDTVTSPKKNLTIEKGSVGDKAFTANWDACAYIVAFDTTGYTFNGKTTYIVNYGELYTFDVIDETSGWRYNDISVTDENGYVSEWNIASDCVLTPNISLYSYTDETKTSLYFGSYPQTKVSDDSIISNLNTLAGTLPTSTNTYKWTDYGYYRGGSASSYMYYIDIDEDLAGDYDYRGVYFTWYRPFYITGRFDDYSQYFQSTNGYSTNIVYWFKYEPIKWNILKTENNKALIISDLILDSQDYNYTTSSRSSATVDQGNTTSSTIYANNYMYSHIRSWLNITFYDTAFSALEKEIIEITEVDNSASTTSSSTNEYACQNTEDKLYLLSYQDVNNKAYGFTVERSRVAEYDGERCYYWLRSNRYTSDVNIVSSYGDIYRTDVNNYYGVRVACKFNSNN